MPRRLIIDKSERLQQIAPYFWAEVERTKKRLSKKGIRYLNLGTAVPDLSPSPVLVSEVIKNLEIRKGFASTNDGKEEFKEEIAKWYYKRYAVKLDSRTEILPLLGQREAFYDLSLSLVNPGEEVLICDPCWPVYRGVFVLAGAKVVILPLLEINDYLPNLSLLSKKSLARAKIFLFNYPHNPTSAVADLNFFRQLVNIARKSNLVLIQDAVYNEIYYEGYKPPSLLQVEGARRFALEVHSLIFTYNLSGLPLAFAVGNRELISSLDMMQKNFSSHLSDLFFKVGSLALRHYEQIVEENNRIYQKRRDLMQEGFYQVGWRVKKPKATPFIWVEIPRFFSSAGFTRRLVRKTGVILAPGSWFGENGEGFVRISLTRPETDLQQALLRLRNHRKLWQRKYRTGE